MKANVESKIILDSFSLRWYQEELWDTIRTGSKRKIIAVLPRRAGKDLVCWNAAIRRCLEETCLVLYALPTAVQARRAIFEAITSDNKRFLDYIPSQLIKSINKTEQKIVFINDSILQCIGGEDHDRSIRGTNPKLVVCSEMAYMDAQAVYDTISPILAANGGTFVAVSTPFGKNSFWHMYEVARHLPDWKVIYHKTSEINHIPQEALVQEKARMSYEKFMQEFECDWALGVEATFFGKDIERLRQRGQITSVMHEPGLLVHVAIDIGVNDATTAVFFQLVGDGTLIRIIDCSSYNNLGLDHLASILQEKGKYYRYGNMWAPHDIKVREWGGGAVSRYEKARNLGLEFQILPQIPLEDGIENIRTHIPKFWIDAEKCKSLLDAMENYQKTPIDASRGIFSSKPIRNWATHYCFTPETLVLTYSGMRQIIDVKENDLVFTLEGWKPCTKSYLIRKNADLVEVTFQDGMKVRCTPDHMFLTEKGWKYAKDLQMDFVIQSESTHSSSTSMELSTEFTKMKNIFLQCMKDFIGRFGERLSEIFRRAVTYTTKTEIVPITPCPTLNVSQVQTIILYPETDQVSQRPVEMPQTFGISLTKEENGIGSKQLDASHGKKYSDNLRIVRNVVSLSKPLLEMDDPIKNTVTPIAKLVQVISVVNLKEKSDVYCFSVPSVGHFSLSNGAIVKNCDAVRYMCQSIPMSAQGLTSQEFDRKRAEALYGNNSPLPRFFDKKIRSEW